MDSKKYLTKELSEDIEVHDTLNPKLFGSDDKLKPIVLHKVKEIANEFVKTLKDGEIEIKIKDIILIGSNVSYNYTKDSDLDIHILADSKSLDCPYDLYSKLYSAYRSLFNKKLSITFYGIPVEIYVETDDTPRVSNGVYSVLKNDWVKEPVKQNIPEINLEEFEKDFEQWETRYFDLLNKLGMK